MLCTQVFLATAPIVARVGPVIAGRVFHDVVDSAHVVLVLVAIAPPAALVASLALSTCSRSCALCTVPPTALRSKRKTVCITGDPSTVRTLLAPAVAVGDPAFTVVSATGFRVNVAASAGDGDRTVISTTNDSSSD